MMVWAVEQVTNRRIALPVQHVHLAGDWIWILCLLAPAFLYALWRIVWALEAIAISKGARRRSWP